MNIKACLWWMCFFPIAIVFQAYIPTLDAILIGLVLVLQERRYKDLLWLLPLCILVQEGIGSRFFGGMLLWYTMIIFLFLIGRWLFEVQSLLFVILMSCCLGVLYFSLAYLLAPLQDLHINVHEHIKTSIIQTCFIPIAWWFTSLTRRWVYVHDKAV